MNGKIRAPLNRTIDITPEEINKYKKKLIRLDQPVDSDTLI